MSKSSAATNPTPLLETLQVLQFPVDDEFDPDPLEVVPGEEFTLQYLGTGSTTVEIYDSNNDLYDLFKGGSNPYSVDDDGTNYEIIDEAPEDSTYTIVWESGTTAKRGNGPKPGKGPKPGHGPGHGHGHGGSPNLLAAVRGTINVKKPSL